jgi:hypothetical protein
MLGGLPFIVGQARWAAPERGGAARDLRYLASPSWVIAPGLAEGRGSHEPHRVGAGRCWICRLWARGCQPLHAGRALADLRGGRSALPSMLRGTIAPVTPFLARYNTPNAGRREVAAGFALGGGGSPKGIPLRGRTERNPAVQLPGVTGCLSFVVAADIGEAVSL